jgi:hypothetical protein
MEERVQTHVVPLLAGTATELVLGVGPVGSLRCRPRTPFRHLQGRRPARSTFAPDPGELLSSPGP